MYLSLFILVHSSTQSCKKTTATAAAAAVQLQMQVWLNLIFTKTINSTCQNDGSISVNDEIECLRGFLHATRHELRPARLPYSTQPVSLADCVLRIRIWNIHTFTNVILQGKKERFVKLKYVLKVWITYRTKSLQSLVPFGDLCLKIIVQLYHFRSLILRMRLRNSIKNSERNRNLGEERLRSIYLDISIGVPTCSSSFELIIKAEPDE